MDFEFSETSKAVQSRLRDFMAEHVAPRDPEWHELVERQGIFPPPFIEDLKAKARAAGLWNLFLPHLKDDEPGTRLSNLDYAPCAEIMGRYLWSSEVFNCNAPDTGNMEVLHMFGTPEQKRQWLVPLLNGEIRSAFAMTEPDVASSDATNIRTTIRRDGDQYVIDGRKWFITNAADPRCKILIVLGLSNPERTESHRRHSMVLVPMDTPGVEVVRNPTIMHHLAHEGHCEMRFTNVRVPVANLVHEEGEGFAIAQARLGPGRIHHCMRSIGQCELALELMVERAGSRKTFGHLLQDHGTVAEWIALSRLEIEQARLLVLKTAWLIDKYGTRAARKEVGLIKVVVPRMQTAICNRAIQTFGAAGLTPDTPLAFLWTWGRALQIIDGPDEVHLRTIARLEAKEQAARRPTA
ncbi:acyl-CoA dehydrogenase [Aliidongia dinghuensis]|uniref:Acyl-CoA dehydrogenase n=1 Tax=Aliidongia dinghuensis TaxID=1867774 RepID=A0A8J2YU94_9PROT|nr:acyl-CoA dehydrogenase family protein [Aliidongia dinghuensis]GGF21949.1 acyl-CoA dehydrogenase [Aliidongia dinghuensis]